MKKSKLMFLLTAILILSTTGVLAATPVQLWNTTWGGTGSDRMSTTADSLAIDPTHQYLYVTSNIADGTGDLALIKYNLTGTQIWNLTVGDPATADISEGVEVDSNGNVYLVGSYADAVTPATTSKWVVFAFNSSGSQLWNNTQDLASSVDRATSVTVDSSNNVYVVGTGNSTNGVCAQASLQNCDTRLIKYDSNGNILMDTNSMAFTPSTYDFGGDVKVDGSGNIYIASKRISSVMSIIVSKLDSSGNLLWQTWAYNSTTQAGNTYSLDFDNSGNIIVTGNPATTGLLGTNIVTVKLDTSGNILWTNVEDIDADFAFGTAVNRDNEIYILGRTNSTGTLSPILYKYNSTGSKILTMNPLWTTGTGKNDLAFDILYYAGNVYIAGTTDGQGAGSYDAYLTAYKDFDFTTDLALYYNFSQTSGNILDSSPSGVNTNDYEINSRTATGILGNAYDFEATGRDDYILLPYNAALNRYADDQFTYNIWIKPESFDESFFFPGRCNYATDWNREICWAYTTTTNEIYSYVVFADDTGAGGQTTSLSFAANPMTLNEWQMMTYTYDNNYLKVYRNGALVSSYPYNGSIFDDTTVGAVTTFSKMHSSEPFAGTANYDGLADEWGFWKRGMQQTEVQSLYETYLAGCDPLVNATGCASAPTITFNYQTPPDINATNFLGPSGVAVSYNITDASGVDNTSIRLFYKSNSTVSDTTYYINGTAYSGYLNASYTTASGSSYNWQFFDNQILPARYNLPERAVETATKTDHTLSSQSEEVAIQILNVSVNQYNWFEIDTNRSAGTGPLRVYYCNDNYNFAQAVTASSSCTLFNTITTNTYDHCHGPGNSCHMRVSLPMNTTSGTVNNLVPVTSKSWFVLRGAANPGTTWIYRTVSNTSRDGAMRTTANGGTSWTNQTWTVDAHFHQYELSETFYKYACGQDTLGNYGCSAPMPDLFELANLPPSAPTITTPTGTTYYTPGIINIQYTAAQSPNSYAITNYNISLLDSSEAFVTTIIENNGVNLDYTWNTTGIIEGNYTISVEACDTMNQCSKGFSDVFTIIPFVPEVPKNTSARYDFENNGLNSIDNSFLGNLTPLFGQTRDYSNDSKVGNYSSMFTAEEGWYINSSVAGIGDHWAMSCNVKFESSGTNDWAFGSTPDIWADNYNCIAEIVAGSDNTVRLATAVGQYDLFTRVPGQWENIILYRNGTQFDVYRNGNHILTRSEAFSCSQPQAFVIAEDYGLYAGGNVFTGKVDNCYILNKTLESSDFTMMLEANPCTENWSPSYSACLQHNKTLLYTDLNTCGTTNNLPIDNGTISSCNYTYSRWDFENNLVDSGTIGKDLVFTSGTNPLTYNNTISKVNDYSLNFFDTYPSQVPKLDNTGTVWSGDYAVGCWYKPPTDAWNDYYMMISIGDASRAGSHTVFTSPSGWYDPGCLVDWNTNDGTHTGVCLTLGSGWEHFIFSEEGGMFKIYRNGTLVYSNTGNTIGANDIMFGSRYNTPPDQTWKGQMDNCVFMNGTINSNDIAFMMEGSSTIPPPPTAPEIISPTGGEIITSSPLTITWNQSTSQLPLSYNISYSTDNLIWQDLSGTVYDSIGSGPTDFLVRRDYSDSGNNLLSGWLEFTPNQTARLDELHVEITNPSVASTYMTIKTSTDITLAVSGPGDSGGWGGGTYPAKYTFSPGLVVQANTTYRAYLTGATYRTFSGCQSQPGHTTWNAIYWDTGYACTRHVSLFWAKGGYSPVIKAYDWNISSLSDGYPYYVKVLADDGLLSSSSSSGAFTINLDAPTNPEFITPLFGDIVTTSPNIVWTESISVPSVNYTLSYSTDNSTWSELITTNGTSYYWNMSLLPDGDYFLKLTTNDSILMAETLFTKFTADLNAPSAPTIIYPNGGETLTGQPSGIYNITWTASTSELPINYSVLYSNDNGLTWNFLSLVPEGTTNYEWDISNMSIYPAGVQYKVKVNVTDGYLSNIDVSDSSFEIVQNIAPVITGVAITPTLPIVLDSPLYGNCNATDDGISQSLTYSYKWFKNGQSLGITTMNLAQTISPRTYVKGDNMTFECSVYDGLVTVRQNSSVVTIQNRLPTTPIISSPANNSMSSESLVQIDYSSTDYDNDIIYYEVYLDSNSVPTTLVQNSTSSNYSFTGADGEYYIMVRATDGSGYSEYSDIVHFGINTVHPVITLLTPQDSKYTRTEQVTFTYNVNSFYDIDYCEIYFNNILIGTQDNPLKETVITYKKDLYEIRNAPWYVYCVDENGLTTTSETRVMTIVGASNSNPSNAGKAVQSTVGSVQNSVNLAKSSATSTLDSLSEAWSKVPLVGQIEFKQALLGGIVLFIVWQFVYRKPTRRRY